MLQQRVVNCQKCPRLVSWREEIARKKRRAYRYSEYWGKPVPGFGDVYGRIMVVGLAPGAHGANRTGRMFTGDASGDFLYAALYRAGFANQPESHSREDGLQLRDLYISAVCRCVPPKNKPAPDEVKNCLPYLEEEIELMQNLRGLITLGRLAFESVLRIMIARAAPVSGLTFKHGAFYPLGDGLPWVLASYHPSRQNTQTGRLTQIMFDQIWNTAVKALD